MPSDPGEGGTAASAVPTVDSALASGGVSRIEIELFAGELVAREVQVEADDAEEKIVSPVTAIDPGQGTLTLELGGLTVSYGASTRFRTEPESHEGRETWEALVQDEIAAADLRLENQLDEPKIELYVDGDNQASARGSSELVLRVLGLSITVNGRTRLGPGDDGQPSGASVEFVGCRLGECRRSRAEAAGARRRPRVGRGDFAGRNRGEHTEDRSGRLRALESPRLRGPGREAPTERPG